MSVITNLIVSFGELEDKDARIDDINRFFIQNDRVPLLDLRTKYDLFPMYVWEAVTLVGTYNHLILPDLFAHLLSIDWDTPDFVQVFVKEHEDSYFRIYHLSRSGGIIEVLE